MGPSLLPTDHMTGGLAAAAQQLMWLPPEMKPLLPVLLRGAVGWFHVSAGGRGCAGRPPRRRCQYDTERLLSCRPGPLPPRRQLPGQIGPPCIGLHSGEVAADSWKWTAGEVYGCGERCSLSASAPGTRVLAAAVRPRRGEGRRGRWWPPGLSRVPRHQCARCRGHHCPSTPLVQWGGGAPSRMGTTQVVCPPATLQVARPAGREPCLCG